MPPRTRKETTEAILMVDPEQPLLNPETNSPPPYLVTPGKFVHVVINGQTRHKGAEVLDRDGMGLTLRTDENGLTRSEISFIPWSAIEGVGIVGAR